MKTRHIVCFIDDQQQYHDKEIRASAVEFVEIEKALRDAGHQVKKIVRVYDITTERGKP